MACIWYLCGHNQWVVKMLNLELSLTANSEITQCTINHLISHLYLITLLEKDNQMGSEQLSIIFGTNLFGIENWLEKDQLESTQASN